MEIREIMSEPVLSMRSDMTVKDCARMMAEKRISSVVITKKDQTLGPLQDIGLVTERDIIVKVVSKGRSTDTKLAEIMSHPPICMAPESSLEAANDLMHERHIRRIMVCEDDKVIGIVSQRDLLKNLRYFNVRKILHKI